MKGRGEGNKTDGLVLGGRILKRVIGGKWKEFEVKTRVVEMEKTAHHFLHIQGDQREE